MLDLTGTAPGGKPLTYFEVFVGIDLGADGTRTRSAWRSRRASPTPMACITRRSPIRA